MRVERWDILSRLCRANEHPENRQLATPAMGQMLTVTERLESATYMPFVADIRELRCSLT
jgi:hypothetical protein